MDDGAVRFAWYYTSRRFCHCRERKYYPFDDLNDFGNVVKVKENAPKLLRKALSRLPVDVVMTGDYQPAEQWRAAGRFACHSAFEVEFPNALVTSDASRQVARLLESASPPTAALLKLLISF